MALTVLACIKLCFRPWSSLVQWFHSARPYLQFPRGLPWLRKNADIHSCSVCRPGANSQFLLLHILLQAVLVHCMGIASPKVVSNVNTRNLGTGWHNVISGNPQSNSLSFFCNLCVATEGVSCLFVLSISQIIPYPLPGDGQMMDCLLC